MYLRIQTDQDGNLINNNQVMDYWYQSETLSHMNYYDFTHCITLNNKNSVKYTEKDLPQLRTLARHALQEQHPLTKAHHLLEHTNKEHSKWNNPLAPRVVGTIVPHKKTGSQWKLFTLTHFKPFGLCNLLLEENMSVEDTYAWYTFSKQSRLRMRNWKATHKCEDE